MLSNDLTSTLLAYRGGLKADIIQAKTEGKVWGPIYCVPPCSPAAMERAGRQFARARAEAIRHCRQARLRGLLETEEVVVITVLPQREQTIARLKDGIVLRVGAYLTDCCADRSRRCLRAPAPVISTCPSVVHSWCRYREQIRLMSRRAVWRRLPIICDNYDHPGHATDSSAAWARLLWRRRWHD